MLSTLDEEDGLGARWKPVRLLSHSPEEEEIEVCQIQDMDMVPDLERPVRTYLSILYIKHTPAPLSMTAARPRFRAKRVRMGTC